MEFFEVRKIKKQIKDKFSNNERIYELCKTHFSQSKHLKFVTNGSDYIAVTVSKKLRDKLAKDKNAVKKHASEFMLLTLQEEIPELESKHIDCVFDFTLDGNSLHIVIM